VGLIWVWTVSQVIGEGESEDEFKRTWTCHHFLLVIFLDVDNNQEEMWDATCSIWF